MRRLASVVTLFAAFTTPLMAQSDATKLEIPQISVSARGEVKMTPDRANIQISVQSRASTAAAAAAENAKKQAAVIASIRALGIADEQISTANYSVSPEQKYEANHPPVITGYVVTNTVNVEVRKISSVGPVIDAALSHGANLISGLSFFSSNTESARRAAIALAVSSARADAEAAAKAAGGSLGALMELAIGSYSPPIPRPMYSARASISGEAMQADTPISPGQETLSVDISTRWRFIPAN